MEKDGLLKHHRSPLLKPTKVKEGHKNLVVELKLIKKLQLKVIKLKEPQILDSLELVPSNNNKSLKMMALKCRILRHN